MRATISILIAAACSTAALGDDLVCANGKIVEAGMTAAQVREKCGPPTDSEVRVVDSKARGEYGVYKAGTVKVEIWRYDRGTGRQAAVLEFRDGKLFSIEYVEDR